MCDYSLHAHPNRLAVEGETLLSTRFPGGSMGFAAPADLPHQTSWDHPESKPLVAVCVPPGAQLVLEDIPARLQHELGVSDTEFVTFTQLGFEAYTHRDGVRFENGREILLQRLNENQRARVLSLANAMERETEIAARRVAETEPAAARVSVFRRAWDALVGTIGPKAPAKETTQEDTPSRQYAHEL